jgi:hypothetical protein
VEDNIRTAVEKVGKIMFTYVVFRLVAMNGQMVKGRIPEARGNTQPSHWKCHGGPHVFSEGILS